MALSNLFSLYDLTIAVRVSGKFKSKTNIVCFESPSNICRQMALSNISSDFNLCCAGGWEINE